MVAWVTLSSAKPGSSHAPAVLRLSERPASRRGHCAVGRPLLRRVSITEVCGQPAGEPSQVSCRP